MKNLENKTTNTNEVSLGTTRLTREEAANYLRISLVSIDRAIARKNIAYFRLGRRVIFGIHHLDEFLSRNEIPVKVRGGKFNYAN